MDSPFIGPAYLHRSVNAAAQRCVNLYPEIIIENENRRLILVGCPGRHLFATVGAGPIRGAWKCQKDGRVFVVSGSQLYEVYASQTSVLRGTLASASGPVSMADNGLQLAIVDGPKMYILTLATSSFGAVTDPAFPGANTIGFQDGYFIFNDPGTGRFYITALYDGYDINALDFATAEGAPDNVIALIVDHREVWLFGTSSIEVFFNSGNNSFPFERIQGAFIEHGCAAAFSPVKMDNSVFWLGADDKGQGMVWRANGYTPERISTHAIEYAIKQYARIDDAIGFAYQDEGHTFYQLTFPSANATWVYDAATKWWHERAWTDGNGELNRVREESHVAAFGKHIVGDRENGSLYELNLDFYDDFGGELTALRSSPHHNNPRSYFTNYDHFELLTETGVGLDGVQQGDDPVVLLDWSNDGGHTWSHQKRLPLGRIGEFTRRARISRLGRSRNRVWRTRITDPVKRTMTGVDIGAREAAA